jgi:hypothetical protein
VEAVTSDQQQQQAAAAKSPQPTPTWSNGVIHPPHLLLPPLALLVGPLLAPDHGHLPLLLLLLLPLLLLGQSLVKHAGNMNQARSQAAVVTQL